MMTDSLRGLRQETSALRQSCDDRFAPMLMAVAFRVAGITSVAITVEPVGGSLQPTTTPILTGEMPRRAKA